MQKLERVIIIGVVLVITDAVLLIPVVRYFDVCNFTLAVISLRKRFNQTAGRLPVVTFNHILNLFLLLFAEKLSLIVSV